MTRVLLPLDSSPRPPDAEALPDSSGVCMSSSVLADPDPDPTRSTWTQRSKPASPSPGPSAVPVSSQTSSLGHRRKGLGRKVRRNHRARARPGGTGGGDRKSGKEDRMEEDGEQEEERMEAETLSRSGLQG